MSLFSELRRRNVIRVGAAYAAIGWLLGPTSNLGEFLFGAERRGLARLRAGLGELQKGQCFYCGSRMSGPGEVDHFIPWARYPDNGIENLVAAQQTLVQATIRLDAACRLAACPRKRAQADIRSAGCRRQ